MREDGTTYLELDHDRGKLVALRQFDDRGRWLLEERFHAGRLDKQRRPLVAAISIQIGKDRHDVTCDDHGRCIAFAVSRGGRRISRLDNKKLGKLMPERFEKELRRRYHALMTRPELRLSFDERVIARLGVAHFRDPLRVAALAEDRGGNAVVLVEEGKHRGRVYFLHHPLADSLEAFFRGLTLRSHLTHYRSLERFAPVESRGGGRRRARVQSERVSRRAAR